MNQGNLCPFYYFYPPFFYYQSNTPIQDIKQQTMKVETQVNENWKKECFLEKSTNFNNKEKLAKKKLKVNRKQSEDSSFQVQESRRNKSLKQKTGRNSGSHLLRIFAKMLKSHVKNKLKLSITLKQFYSYTNSIGISYQKYIKVSKVIKGIRSKQGYGLVLYNLFYIFISKYARPAVLTSSKTQSKNMLPTLSQIRKINQQMIQSLRFRELQNIKIEEKSDFYQSSN